MFYVNTKTRKRILYSILISLLIHIGFLVWSFFVRIMPSFMPPEKPVKVFHVNMLQHKRIGQRMPDLHKIASMKTAKPENPFVSKTSDPFVDPDNNSHKAIEAPVPTSVTPMPQSSKKSEISDAVLVKKVKQQTRKDLVEVGDVPHVDLTPGHLVDAGGESTAKDLLEKGPYPLFASQVMPARAANGSNEFQAMKRNAAGLSPESKAGDLGTTLTYELSTYQDPKTGQKYFKLLVKVKDATVRFPVIPKEIIFLMDASGSIDKPRLEQFKQGVAESLRQLNPKDHFNIIVFKGKTMYLSAQSLTPEHNNIRRAMGFLGEVMVGGATDVYSAIDKSMDRRAPYNPSYRLLLSDGYPTKGIVDARELINKISEINRGRVPIFSFGGGEGVSRYMLDFVAYKNRGWSQVEDREYFIGREIAKMYNRIKDPLLLKLRYHVGGLKEDDIYPKILPDFFKGAEFVIYGTYTNENKFVVQVLGNTTDQTKEFMVNASLREAAIGNKEIARAWAFHKIYHLIGELKYNADNKSIIQEIDDLCARYNIVTPYSKNFRRK